MDRVLFYDTLMLKCKQKPLKTVAMSEKLNHLLGKNEGRPLQICPQSKSTNFALLKYSH